MAKNYVQRGDVLTVTAPAGGVSSGDPVLIEALFGVATGDAAAGEDLELSTIGVYRLPKVSAQAWLQGAAIYFDSGAGNCTTVDTSNTFVGYAARSAANPSATGTVKLSV